ncbi:MAG: aliphatic sulfonates family transporter, periplasmic ligand-binding protein [Paenibacillaceae bacterium]|jgi:sulfonate transport system substrate-binding protein|nr:aliphatic sulfonates family transporter, periplasmic ligand-binding protein [Paenibacillaceae bacterium]
MNVSKRIAALLVLSVALVAALGGCGKKDDTSGAPAAGDKGYSATEIRLAIQPFPLYSPIYVAKNKGWIEEGLKDLGVTVKWTSFNSGPLVNESFAAGQQDIGVLGDVPAIIAKSAGQDLKIIANAAYGPKALAFVVPKDSAITKPEELKGKKVAVVKGSYAHHLLILVLNKAGLGINDITVVNLAAGDMQNALVTKAIDAAVTWEPFITKYDDAGIAKVLVDGTGIKRANLVIYASNKFVTQNPKLTEIYLDAYKKGYEYIKSNPKEAAELIAKDIGLEAEQLARIFSKFDYNPLIQDVDVAELKVVEKFMRDEKLIENAVDIDKYVDKTYLNGAGIK